MPREIFNAGILHRTARSLRPSAVANVPDSWSATASAVNSAAAMSNSPPRRSVTAPVSRASSPRRREHARHPRLEPEPPIIGRTGAGVGHREQACLVGRLPEVGGPGEELLVLVSWQQAPCVSGSPGSGPRASVSATAPRPPPTLSTAARASRAGSGRHVRSSTSDNMPGSIAGPFGNRASDGAVLGLDIAGVCNRWTRSPVTGRIERGHPT